MADPAELVILIPMLGRPHHVAPLLESLRATAPRAFVWWLVTVDDATGAGRDVIDAINTVGDEDSGITGFAPRTRGDYAAKINFGYRGTNRPYIFTGASDIRFEPGWYEAAMRRFADPRIGVVGTNDVHSRRAKLPGNQHATHFLVRRSYADEHGTLDGPGAIFTEAYLHEYVDDEFVGTATRRSAYAYAADSRVPHLHPLWARGEWDATYEAMGPRQQADAQLYRERRRLWT